MKKFRTYFCCFLLVLATTATAFAQILPNSSTAILRLGIVPFNSPLALSKIHQPLIRHLTEAMRRPVRFYTATDHEAFYREAIANGYDLMIVSPHFVPFLIKRGFVPLARYRSGTDIVVALRSDQPFHTLEDLRGKHIGFPDRLAFVTINSIRWFESQGMVVNRDFYIEIQHSLATSLTAVALGKLDIAVTASTAFKSLPDDIRARLKTYKLTKQPQPSLMILAKTDLGKTTLKQLQAGLNSFPRTPEGEAFFQETGYLGFAPVTQHDLDALSVYVNITEQLLEHPTMISLPNSIKRSN